MALWMTVIDKKLFLNTVSQACMATNCVRRIASLVCAVKLTEDKGVRMPTHSDV